MWNLLPKFLLIFDKKYPSKIILLTNREMSIELSGRKIKRPIEVIIDTWKTKTIMASKLFQIFL